MEREFFGKENNENFAVENTESNDGSFIETQAIIGEKEIAKATQILSEYKNGKANLESRVVEDELWYELRFWSTLRKNKAKEDMTPEPTSAWLFNAITSKHADFMDNYPEAVVLPRERSDEEAAKRLSSVLPCVMDYNDFKTTYSICCDEKLKHGTGVYGVFWNQEKENGIGDIDIKNIDLLKIFWEPGIQDIQKSKNLFIIDLCDKDLLEQQYPEHKGKFSSDTINITEYSTDESIDTSNKAVVVDWYYKVRTRDGRNILQYCKYCGNAILYASENDPSVRDIGWYAHGEYPVVFDTLYRVKGTPCGFGYVAICKDPQTYIDKLSANIMQSSLMGTKKRFFASTSTNINEDEFLDWNKQIVHVEGELNDTRLKEIQVTPLAPIYQNILNMKVEEMKETASNRDATNGGGQAGVSAAAAISALQEAGNKVSRDMISASYNAYTKVVKLCIELMRQFYDESRSFRITGKTIGEYEYVEMNNLMLKDQSNGTNVVGEVLYRHPVFDLKVNAQKTNPFSRMEENERAKELYRLAFFSPDKAQESLSALEMMDFEGIDKVRESVSKGQTLLNIVQQQQQIIAELQGQMAMANPMANGENTNQTQQPMGNVKQENVDDPKGKTFASGVMKANTPMTSYGERLAKRSAPSMDTGNAMNPLAK